MRNPMHRPITTFPPPEPRDAPWSTLIPDDQWEVFRRGTRAIQQAGVTALLGGAMALATYTRHWRSTKDVDVIVLPRDRENVVTAIREAGFDDYFTREPYDRSWIFRGFKDDVIFDVIWELPNHRVTIDDAWFERAWRIRLRDEVYAAVPPEELVRVKLYVMQRERCDWVDVLNVLGGAADEIDWAWLVRRMGRDLPLLHAVLAIFNWMSPNRARVLPDWLRQQLALPQPESEDAEGMEERRVRLFDSRPWFAPLQPADRPLER